MTHLKAKSIADYSQKVFEEKVAKTIKKGEQTLAEVVKTEELATQRRKERAEKYPMCTKLSSVSDERRTLNEFLEWLQEKGIVLCNREKTDSGFAQHGYYEPIRQRGEEVVFSFLEIDPKALEKERQQMLAEQRKANGDTDE